jgi:hypothetical protein
MLRKIRYWIGCYIFPKQIWHKRVVKDDDKFDELLAWSNKMKADGWDDFAAIGDTLYLRKFVPRWKS